MKLGSCHSLETRAKLSAAMTPERRAKISAATIARQAGVPLSPEHRARLMGNTNRLGSHPTDATRAKLSAAQLGNTKVRDATVKGECVYCGGPAQTHDHVVPRGRDGWDRPDNVVLACFSCNGAKQNRTPEEWLADMAA